MRPAIPPAVAERAVEWLVELQSPQVTAQTHAQWQLWRNEHPSHEAAWQRIQAFSQRLEGMQSGAQNTVLHATLTPRLSRRRALKSLAVLITASSVAWTAKDSQWVLEWRSDYRTAVGQQRQVTLSDGTRIQLNTDTALDVQYDAHQRLIKLHTGEILVTSAHDPLSRPLAVETAQGHCTAMSARFSVRQQAELTQVGAFTGPVTLTPEGAAGRIWTLETRQSTWFDRRSVHAATLLHEQELAWTNGMVVAENQRLEDFLDNLARYRRGHLACDRNVADLRISGTYPLADTDLVLATVSKTLQLDLRRFTRYWTTLARREGNA